MPRLEDALRRLPGVLSAEVSLGTGEVRVQYVPSLADLDLVRHTIEEEAGYQATAPPTELPWSEAALDADQGAQPRLDPSGVPRPQRGLAQAPLAIR